MAIKALDPEILGRLRTYGCDTPNDAVPANFDPLYHGKRCALWLMQTDEQNHHGQPQPFEMLYCVGDDTGTSAVFYLITVSIEAASQLLPHLSRLETNIEGVTKSARPASNALFKWMKGRGHPVSLERIDYMLENFVETYSPLIEVTSLT